MKDTTITISGKTDSEGTFKTAENGELQRFFKQFRNHRFILNVQVIPEETSKKMDHYFREYVLVKLQEGFLNSGERMLLDDVKIQIAELYGVEPSLDWFEKLHNIDKIKALNWIKMFGASELHVHIDDPRII